MYSIYLYHFSKNEEALKLYEKVDAALNIEVLKNTKSFAKILENTPNTYTLLVQIEIESEDIDDPLYSKLISSLDDYFTIIRWEESNNLHLALKTNKERISDECKLKNQIILNYPEEDEAMYLSLLKDLILISNYFYNLEIFYNQGMKPFRNIIKLDSEVMEKYQWKLPSKVDDIVLEQIENWLEIASKNYFQIAANHHLILTHNKNVKKIAQRIQDKYHKELKIDPITVMNEEFELKNLTSETIYQRVKDLKDISLGKIETQKLDQNTQLQKELITIQKYSNTIQKSTIIIELFIVYAYTFHIWEVINPEGLESASNLQKFLVPLIVAIGVVIFIEFILELLNKGWLQKTMNKIPEIIKMPLFLIIALIMILEGILFILSH